MLSFSLQGHAEHDILRSRKSLWDFVGLLVGSLSLKYYLRIGIFTIFF